MTSRLAVLVRLGIMVGMRPWGVVMLCEVVKDLAELVLAHAAGEAGPKIAKYSSASCV